MRRALSASCWRGLGTERTANVVHSIEAHHFRDRSIQPQTLGPSLYDADRLDSIGAIGVGRGHSPTQLRCGSRLWRGRANRPPLLCRRWRAAEYTPVHEYVHKLVSCWSRRDGRRRADRARAACLYATVLPAGCGDVGAGLKASEGGLHDDALWTSTPDQRGWAIRHRRMSRIFAVVAALAVSLWATTSGLAQSVEPDDSLRLPVVLAQSECGWRGGGRGVRAGRNPAACAGMRWSALALEQFDAETIATFDALMGVAGYVLRGAGHEWRQPWRRWRSIRGGLRRAELIVRAADARPMPP